MRELDDDPDFYKDVDVLLRCTSEGTAEEYLGRIMGIATPQERDAIARTFFGISHNTMKKSTSRATRSQKGGHVVSPYIYDLLSVADTVHDFREAVEDIQDVLAVPFVLPKEIQERDVRNENGFVNAMARHKNLHFQDRAVVNPVHGANILARFKIDDTTPIEQQMERQIQQAYGKIGNHAELVPMDVWTVVRDLGDPTDTRRAQVLKLHQIAHVICVMRQRFGHDAAFVIDASGNSLVTLVFAFRYISRAFFKRFVTDPPTTNTAELSSRLHEAIRHAGIPDLEWTVAITDANMFDAADNATPLPLDARATGNVFADHQKCQVTLQGITTAGGRRVHATVRDTDGREHVLSLTNTETTSTFGKRGLQQTIASALNDRQPTSTSKVIKLLSVPTLYALKRAGDWGQVAHCRNYQKVFVTSDKLAALYAHSQGVWYVFMAFEEHMPEEPHPVLPDFFRYSFMIR